MTNHQPPLYITPAEYISLYPKYLAAMTARKKSIHTLKSYDVALRKFRDYLDETKPDEITPLTVEDWTSAMLEGGVSTNSANNYYGTIARFFQWATRMKLVQESPMPEDGAPKRKFTAKDIPTRDEILRLLDPKNIPHSINAKLPKRNYAIVAFLILTGLRSDELRELCPADLDYETNTLTVRNGKGSKERQAPFPPKAQEVVRNYLASGIRPNWATNADPLFGTHQLSAKMSDEEKEDETNLWHKFDAATLGRLVKRYGMRVIGRDIHPHLLRHCAASLWDDAGANLRDVQEALGHSSIRTTEQVYLHTLNKKKAAASISQMLTAIL